MHTKNGQRPFQGLFKAGFCRPVVVRLALWWALLSSLAGFAAEPSVVINEIMYHPPGGATNLQFVELFNPTPREVDLSSWAFKKGVQFTFPAGTKIGGRAFLVLCRDRAAFAAHYGPAVRTLGPFEGKLSHRGETLQLTDAQGNKVDSVRFSDRAPWPRGADGFSSSLERICPFVANDGPENWAASTWPASKAAAGTPGRQNDAYSEKPPPVISVPTFSPKTPTPAQSVTVRASVADAEGVQGVVLKYRLAVTGGESEERTLEMKQVSGDEKDGVYQAMIPAQAAGHLVRFRIAAENRAGGRRFMPAETEPRPAFSYFCFTNTAPALIAQGFIVDVGRPIRGRAKYEPGRQRGIRAEPLQRGNAAFLYVPSDGSEPETFDFVKMIVRHGGYKIHFQDDQPLKNMTGINLIFEGPRRWVLAEPLAYDLYRLAGVPAELSEHVRLTLDGRGLGFHLLVEQPNKGFLARNGRDTSGDLYKLLWYGQGIVGQHEKKTNLSTDHTELINLIQGLQRRSGAQQWAFIEQHFNVDEFVSYYAVNMCIQNWDGFFNNYDTYHDTGRTGKWEIYPWDEDKTWGDYDGASPRYDWYSMPLTFGMKGDNPGRGLLSFGGGPFGGANWWRPPGFFSGPLLANPQFRQRFRTRLRELCETVFTEKTFNPIIDTMERRLQGEVRLRAEKLGENPDQAAREFAGEMQSFRNQVRNRRAYILKHLAE